AEFAATHQILTMCYNPLAGGMLARRPDPQTAPSRFATSSLAAMYKERYWSAELLTAVNPLADVADQAGMSLAELNLRWVASQPATGALLLGGNRTEQLLANLDFLARGPLPEDVSTACTAISTPLMGAMPPYNR
ncbi:MAG: aldo/keto reductase, partial [Beutenbergiaceae bacterium]